VLPIATIGLKEVASVCREATAADAGRRLRCLRDKRRAGGGWELKIGKQVSNGTRRSAPYAYAHSAGFITVCGNRKRRKILRIADFAIAPAWPAVQHA
jgi:hypothetical protein